MAEVVIILYYVNKTQEITSLGCISKVIEYWLVLALFRIRIVAAQGGQK